MFCVECGKELPDDAVFCDNCGAPVKQEKSSPDKGQEADGIRRKSMEAAKKQLAGAVEQLAPSQPGEVELCAFGSLTGKASEMVSGAAAPVLEIAGPFMTLLRGMKSFVQGFPGLFKNKQWIKLIFAILLAAVWLVLMLLSYNETEVPFLNWLTFARGGMGRSVAGWFGGLLGKTTVAAMLFSLFGGGFKSLGSGVKSLFRKTNFQKNALGSLTFGAGLALIAYQAFAGDASLTDTMSAISGALLSVMALGRGSGFLWSMAESITARKTGKTRNAQKEKLQGMLTGMTFGFTLGALVTFIPFGWCSLILGGTLLVIGIVLSLVFGKAKEVAA